MGLLDRIRYALDLILKVDGLSAASDDCYRLDIDVADVALLSWTASAFVEIVIAPSVGYFQVML